MEKDFSDVKRWSELTVEEKRDYFKKVSILFAFLRQNRGKKISWNQINQTLDLTHLYRFTIDEADEDISFDDEGIWMES